MIPRKTLTLAKPLASKTLNQIKTKCPPQMIEKRIVQDKAARKKRIESAVKWLCKQYPACFNLKEVKPLKLKINDDVFQDHAVLAPHKSIPSKSSLRDAIKYYTHNVNYLKSHMKYDMRINLQGEVVSDDGVTAKQRAYAVQHLADIDRRNASMGKRYQQKHKKPQRKLPTKDQKKQSYKNEERSSHHRHKTSNIGYLGRRARLLKMSHQRDRDDRKRPDQSNGNTENRIGKGVNP